MIDQSKITIECDEEIYQGIETGKYVYHAIYKFQGYLGFLGRGYTEQDAKDDLMYRINIQLSANK